MWQPLELDGTLADGRQVWINDVWQVLLRTEFLQDEDETAPSTLIHLSIKRIDQQPAHDWRAFQQIKNELAGPEWEAVEIYPRESRLVDTANQYHLWCFDHHLELGFPNRLVVEDTKNTGAVQRPWCDNTRPHDLTDIDNLRADVADYMKKTGMVE